MYTNGERIRGAIALLSQDPRPPGARALQGRPGLRVRVGDCRIIYTIDDNVLLIVVVGGIGATGISAEQAPAR
jgi:mRNA interferase RelE/StbE